MCRWRHKQTLIGIFTQVYQKVADSHTSPSPLNNPKDPGETNLPAIYCHSNLNGRQRTPRMAYLVIAIVLLVYVTIWRPQQRRPLCPCGFFSQTSSYNNPMLLLAISVLHSEQFNSYPLLLNSYQAYFPLTMQISTSNELGI